MPKLPPDELSRHPTKGYRISCGYYIKDGRRTPKVFWLGKDKARAVVEAQKIRYALPIAMAMGGWTKAYEQTIRRWDSLGVVQRQFEVAERMRQALAPNVAAADLAGVPVPLPQATPEGPAAAAGGGTPKPPPGTPMLHAALDAYVASVREQAGSPKYKAGIADSILAAKRYRPDCPLADVDYGWLERFTGFLKARPASLRKSRATGRREPISPYTVKRLLQHTKQAFDWLGRHRGSGRFGGWAAPGDWGHLFSIELTRLMNKQERDRAADGPEQLTVAEIVKLYRAAAGSTTDLHPILFLMGLFTGQGQAELAATRRDEFDLAAARFTHRRNKTGQKGVYWLPPELVTMLRRYFGGRPAGPDGEAFLTRRDRPLVTADNDSVRQAWDDWRTRAGVGRHGTGFYGLRRFFGDYATRTGGDAVGDAALSHAAKGVRARHYSGYRDFDAVERVGRRLYEELTAAGMFEPVAAARRSKVVGGPVA